MVGNVLTLQVFVLFFFFFFFPILKLSKDPNRVDILGIYESISKGIAT